MFDLVVVPLVDLDAVGAQSDGECTRGIVIPRRQHRKLLLQYLQLGARKTGPDLNLLYRTISGLTDAFDVEKLGWIETFLRVVSQQRFGFLRDHEDWLERHLSMLAASFRHSVRVLLG